METFKRSNQQISLPLNSGAQDGLAKTLVAPIPREKDYQDKEAGFFTDLRIWLLQFARNGSLWRTCQASYQQTKATHLRQLSTPWKRLGIWGAGLRVTSQMRAYPKTGIEYSLSQVLDHFVPITSLLTAANCQGILRRENRAGRKIDKTFNKALEENLRLWSNVAEASGIPQQKAFAPRFVPKLEDIKAAIQTDQYCVARNLTWRECEKLMGFPPNWTAVEGDSLATPFRQSSRNGLGAE